MAWDDYCPRREARAVYLVQRELPGQTFSGGLGCCQSGSGLGQRLKIRKGIDENGREWVNVHDWMKAEYAWLKLTPEQIAERRQKVRDFLDRHPELNQIKTKK